MKTTLKTVQNFQPSLFDLPPEKSGDIKKTAEESPPRDKSGGGSCTVICVDHPTDNPRKDLGY
jgi:hypothetical protein